MRDIEPIENDHTHEVEINENEDFERRRDPSWIPSRYHRQRHINNEVEEIRPTTGSRYNLRSQKVERESQTPQTCDESFENDSEDNQSREETRTSETIQDELPHTQNENNCQDEDNQNITQRYNLRPLPGRSTTNEN
ncbi:hypothetical protein L798_09318 [Zootermopsis nevadensis]|uniref:Uncharacterized protein n=1 Tax=Zootermopsis nevadensis TaxID=136037 RepID=A0A067RDQ5_ZOONE|nr:hypothetical protein L798_09318 [Zootermopsis nevadensis]